MLRVVVRDDLPHGLVVGQHARQRRRDTHLHRLAGNADLVAERDALAGVGGLAVDGDLAIGDQLLHVAA